MTAEALLFNVVYLSASLVAWIVTYAVHSTLILGGTLAILRVRRCTPIERDIALKVGLIAGLVTTTLQATGAIRPLLGPFDASGLIEMRRWNGMSVVPELNEMLPMSGAAVFGARLPDAAAWLRLIPIGLLLVWLVYAAFVLTRVAVATIRARALLGVRRELTAHAARVSFNEVLAALGLRRTVRLTATERIVSPVALGRDEVCVPERVLAEFSAVEQRNVLAHEAAHLVRHDPWWLLFAATLEALFFFQPLHRIARKRLQDEAEFLADDLAVARAGDALTLARCLGKVAEWLNEPGQRPSQLRLLAPAFVESSSSLVVRVRRLVAGEAARAEPARPSQVGVIALLATVVLLTAPVFSGGEVRAWGTPAFHWERIVLGGRTVEVKGTMGGIRAVATEGKSVVVNATRHGRASNPDITFQVVEHAAGVTICVIYPVPPGSPPNVCAPGEVRSLNTPANDIEVEFLVSIPRGVAFTARSATGDISTNLLDGPIDAQTMTGDIDVATTAYARAGSSSGNVRVKMGATTWSDSLRIGTASGNIDVTIPPNASSAVLASSFVGSVRSDFEELAGAHLSFWQRLAPRGSLGEHAAGTIGDGGGRTLILSSTAGKIRIRRGP